MATHPGDFFLSLALLLVLGVVYFLPTMVAFRREHHQAVAIFVLDLLAGWSGIGWLVAIVWACTAVRHDSTTR